MTTQQASTTDRNSETRIPRFRKEADSKQAIKWAKIWFAKLQQFHRQPHDAQWEFLSDQVIAFLRFHRDLGTPAWKRLKIIEALTHYRKEVQGQPAEDLIPLANKMLEIIQIEKGRTDSLASSTIDESRQKIDPNEPDVIQKFRIAVRSTGLAYRTEKTYVRKIYQFMRSCNLKRLDDFKEVDNRHVEGFPFRDGRRWKRRGINTERCLSCFVETLAACTQTRDGGSQRHPRL